MTAVLLADDVGFWRSKQPVEATILESFDDERDLLPFPVLLYGSSLWVDYTKTDQGELKLNDAVRAQRLRVEKRSSGQAGPGAAARAISFWVRSDVVAGARSRSRTSRTTDTTALPSRWAAGGRTW